MNLLAKVAAHSQNICGIAWSPDGQQFVSGGNDNHAFLFDPDVLLGDHHEHVVPQGNIGNTTTTGTPTVHQNMPAQDAVMTPPQSPERNHEATWPDNQIHVQQRHGNLGIIPLLTPPPSPERRGRTSSRPSMTDQRPSSDRNEASRQDVPSIRNGLANPSSPGQTDVHVYSFYHAAAVKALAFAPWQPNLLATGGGSNDRQIHFFHTGSGATLALINVFSQVTSLV
jgi:WD40 repeat protein